MHIKAHTVYYNIGIHFLNISIDLLSKHHTFDISLPSDRSYRHSSPQTKARHCIYGAIKQIALLQ